MKKLWLCLILICVMLLFHMILVMPNIPSYIESKVSFKFSQPPKRLYSFDVYSEGKDYDKLVIYEIDSDIGRFEEHLRNENWCALPLSNEVLNHPLCSLSFDVNMKEMLSCTNGYWYWDSKFYKLIVYDAKSHKVFIRTASVLINPEH